MVINFGSSIKQDLPVPQINLYTSAGRKLSAVNMVTLLWKAAQKMGHELAFRCTGESIAKMRIVKTASMLIHDTRNMTQKLF